MDEVSKQRLASIANPHVEKIIDELRLMLGDIHTDFGHGFDRHGVETVRLDARRLAVDEVALQVFRPPFGHLTST